MKLVVVRDNSNVLLFRQTRVSAIKALCARSRQSGDWSGVLALCEGFKLSIIVELIIAVGTGNGPGVSGGGGHAVRDARDALEGTSQGFSNNTSHPTPKTFE